MPKYIRDQFDGRFAQHDRGQTWTARRFEPYRDSSPVENMSAAISGNSVTANQHRIHFLRIAKALFVAMLAITHTTLVGQTIGLDDGFVITDPLVIAKCGSCHPRDERGHMERISWVRSTPEGWQEALRKTVLEKRVMLTPAEARGLVKSLSASQGLAPEEAKPITYYAERRIHDERPYDGQPLAECTKCHAAARPLSWRRAPEEWRQFTGEHAKQYKFELNRDTVTLLGQQSSLHTAEWDAWRARKAPLDLSGRWLVIAHLQGRGKYIGEMEVERGSEPGEFNTRVKLRSTKDGSEMTRTGQTVAYGGYQWRGRSRGANAAKSPEDPSNDAREAMWFSPDATQGKGRWFWGQYQEFGFDVEMRRPGAGATLLAIDRPSLKIGSKGNSICLLGDRIPDDLAPADISLGPGVMVRRITSRHPTEVVIEVDVAASAVPARNDVAVRSSILKSSLALYDRVDYIKVTPESSLAAFGGPAHERGFGAFEAIGYQRGPDAKAHTEDDIELGSIDVTWSMEVFYAVDSSGNNKVGAVSPDGLFTPAAVNPGVNYDIWVIATALSERNKDNRPLVGKGYVVVTIPEYTFNGRTYVRDLDRWIEEGTW
jgi:quinohemoprotein amine dehydrogenase